MKKMIALMLMIAVSLAASPECMASQDTLLEKAGDWIATLGKPEKEKDRILFERRTARAARRLSKGVEKGARQAGDDMKKAGKKMSEAFQ